MNARHSNEAALTRLEQRAAELAPEDLSVHALVCAVAEGLITKRHVIAIHDLVGDRFYEHLLVRGYFHRHAREAGNDPRLGSFHPVEIGIEIVSYDPAEQLPEELLAQLEEKLESGWLFTAEQVAERRKHPRPEVYLVAALWVQAELVRLAIKEPEALEMRKLVDRWIRKGEVPAGVRMPTADGPTTPEHRLPQADANKLFDILGEGWRGGGGCALQTLWRDPRKLDPSETSPSPPPIQWSDDDDDEDE